MSLYRCASCGSPNVVTDTQAGGIGYNYVKGAVGTAILGAGGAAAGIESKNQTVYKCPDCGMTLSRPMPDEIKTLIDVGVSNLSMRDSLNLRGIKMDWSTLTRQYKNIESGFADSILKQRKADEVSDTEWFENFVREQKENDQLYRVEHENDPEIVKWKEDVAKAEKAREDRAKSLIEVCKQEILKEYDDREQVLRDARKKKSDLEARLATLGFFDFTEKQKIRDEIAAAQQALVNEEEMFRRIYKERPAGSDLDFQAERQAESKTKEEIPIPKAPTVRMRIIAFLDRYDRLYVLTPHQKKAVNAWRFMIYWMEINGELKLDDIVSSYDGKARWWSSNLGDRPIKSVIKKWADALVTQEIATYNVTEDVYRLLEDNELT